MEESDFPSRDAYVKARLDFLRKRLQEMGEEGFHHSTEIDPELELAFLEQIYAIEAEPCVTYAHQLIGKGIELPAPENLDGEALHHKLWEVINGLASLRVFIEHTGHLEDRELYQKLWSDSLNEFTWDMSHCCNGAMHLDLLGGGSEEDTITWLSFYADKEQREEWKTQFPGEPLPQCKNLRCDRDKKLPKPDYGTGESGCNI